jgi:hypothetical protein
MPGTEQAILADRLRRAAQPVADYARLSSARWSRRVPLSIRLQGGASRITIAAGGRAAPQAYTFEGAPDGTPRSHPVYGHGPRADWTWVDQTPRPFLAEAVDATQDQMTEILAGVIDDWCHDLGYR